MMNSTNKSSKAILDELYRLQSRRIFATLIRLVGDFDLAEEVMHEAFAVALEKWQEDGVPAKPLPWLISTARFKAIDTIRRRARFDKAAAELVPDREPTEEMADLDEAQFNDDLLRLIFTCCHPALSQAAQLALTLRETCGLTTEQIASAFLTTPTTIAQRIVRAKAKIKHAGIPYEVPSRSDLPDRLASVLAVIYLVFNEGYSASSGAEHTRAELCDKAIRLGEVLLGLLPEPEVMGLLALMLLHESRRRARTNETGDIILLTDQDRQLWDRGLIAEGQELLTRAFGLVDVGAGDPLKHVAVLDQPGPYTLQAAISAEHARAVRAEETDWEQILRCYDALWQLAPSPVIELNRAVAISMKMGPAAGLELVDAILARGELVDYHFAHAARADFCKKLGRKPEARIAYEAALALARQEPERRFISRQIKELE